MKKRAVEERLQTALDKITAMTVREADWETNENGTWQEPSRCSFVPFDSAESDRIKVLLRPYIETWVIPEVEAALRLVRGTDNFWDSHPER